MGGRLVDYIAQGALADLPAAAGMPAKIALGAASIYYCQDTGGFQFFNSSTVAWDSFTSQTDEIIQDMIAAFLVAGTGITLTYNDAGNQLTVATTVYTDENAQDAIAALIAAGTQVGITVTYDDALNTLSFAIQEASSAEIWGGASSVKVVTPKKLKDWRTPVALVDAATITLDGSTGVNFYVTLGGNRILANPTNFNPGQFGIIHVTQDGTGTRTLAFGTNWKFGSTSIAGNVLTVAAGATDAIHYYVRSDGTITCFIIQNLTGTPTRLALGDLSNVAFSSLTNADVLTYDSGTGKWKNAASAGGGGGLDFDSALTMPVSANFTLLNGAPGTNPGLMIDYGKGVAVYQAAAPGATAQIRFGRSNTVPNPAGFTLTARMDSIDPSNAFAQAHERCLILRNATNGRMILFGEGGTGATLYVQIFSGYTSGQLGQYTAFSVAHRFPWLRITSDGTNLKFYVSTDGWIWVPGAAGTTIANYIGSVDEAGIGCQVNASGAVPQGTLCQSFTLI